MAGRYAVIVAGASQHQVMAGEKLRIDLLAGKKKGDKLTFDKVLLTGGEGGTKIGQPHLAGASVTATVVDNGSGDGLGEGIKGVKLWPLKRRPGDYIKHKGHRQRYTMIQIDAVVG
ncbi:MAG: 50S ribosomal protein L21 [Deltaproteobacteria bacterium]|nr:50S ribosomal protein L21 [Deltaproteobacteria bacterium]